MINTNYICSICEARLLEDTSICSYCAGVEPNQDPICKLCKTEDALPNVPVCIDCLYEDMLDSHNDSPDEDYTCQLCGHDDIATIHTEYGHLCFDCLDQ